MNIQHRTSNIERTEHRTSNAQRRTSNNDVASLRNFFNEILALVFVFHSTFDVRCSMLDVRPFQYTFHGPPGARNNLALICEAPEFLCPASGNNGPAIFALISIQVVRWYEIADPLN